MASDVPGTAARIVAELDAGGAHGAVVVAAADWPRAPPRCGEPAVVLLGEYPDAQALARMADAIALDPRIAVLVLGSLAPDVDALVALASGASGYLPADTTGPALTHAVRALHNGEVVLAPVIANALVRSLRSGTRLVLHLEDGRPISLTHREWDVLVLLRQARTTAEIARRFVVSQGTVRTHVAAVLHKMGAPGRAALRSGHAAGA